MATIAKLIIGADVDSSGVEAGLDRAIQLTKRFQETTTTLLKAAFTNNATPGGARIAQSLLDGLEQTFRTESTQARIELFRGLIDPAEFKKQGSIAAKGFNDGLIQTMQELGKRGLLTDDLARVITDQFRKEGLTAGGAFNEQLNRHLSGGSAGIKAFANSAGGHLDEFGHRGLAPLSKSRSASSESRRAVLRQRVACARYSRS